MKQPPHLNRVFRALANPTRRQILEPLARRDHAVLELAGHFAISQPAVTKHLHVLERAGLITRTRQGRQRRCRLQGQALQASTDWIERCPRCWNARLDGLETFLASTQAKGHRHEDS